MDLVNVLRFDPEFLYCFIRFKHDLNFFLFHSHFLLVFIGAIIDFIMGISIVFRLLALSSTGFYLL